MTMTKDKLERIKVLQRGRLVYSPFIPNEQEIIRTQPMDYRSPFLIEESKFPVEPVKVYKPIEQNNTPQSTKDETPVDYTFPNPVPITESTSGKGKIYKASEKELFKSDIYNAYLKELKSRGINKAEEFAKRLATQDILESRWGQSTLSEHFNFGGVKDFSGNGVQKDTTEYTNGQKKTVKQPFRKFKDLSDYVKYKINLVNKKWKVFNYSPEAYYSVIVSGKQKYATDPDYANKLNKLFKSVWA